MNPPIIHIQHASNTYIAHGKMGRVSCTAGEANAARAYALKHYGLKATVERAPAHDKTSKGNATSPERACYRYAYTIHR